MGRVICKVAETEEELNGHFAVRHAVFVEEQQIFDGTDIDEYDRQAVHLIAVDRDTGAVVGAVRCYQTDPGVWYGGRLAVLEEARHNLNAVGPRLCKLAEKVVVRHGCHRFLAYIQLQNVRFFQRLGWQCLGEPVMHAGLPHQLMQASLAVAQPARKLTVEHRMQPFHV